MTTKRLRELEPAVTRKSTEHKIKEAMNKDVVKKQLELLKFRNTNPAFGFDAKLDVSLDGSVMKFTWENKGHKAMLEADFADYSYKISCE